MDRKQNVWCWRVENYFKMACIPIVGKWIIALNERRKEDIRLVLLGRTGAGKSATGNTILTRKEFQSNVSSTSVTSQCKIGEKQIEGSRYLVVDTPGLFDTCLKQGEIKKEIIRCIHMSLPGPHAFLLVLRADRFTEEEVNTFNQIFELFGEGMSKYAIILFTRLDDLEHEDTSIERFVETANPNLMSLIQKCNGRYIAFNNRGNDNQTTSCVSKLKRMLDQMIHNNSGQYYTNEMYTQAEAEVQKKIRELDIQKKLEKQREVETIQAQFKGHINEIQAVNRQLQQDNATIQKERTNDIKRMELENQRQTEQYHKQKAESAKRFQTELNQIKEKKKRKREADNRRMNQEMINLRQTYESRSPNYSCNIM